MPSSRSDRADLVSRSLAKQWMRSFIFGAALISGIEAVKLIDRANALGQHQRDRCLRRSDAFTLRADEVETSVRHGPKPAALPDLDGQQLLKAVVRCGRPPRNPSNSAFDLYVAGRCRG